MKQSAQVMPMISVDSVDQARAFYIEKLGFGHMMGMLAKDGQLQFCTVTMGGAKIMLNRPNEKMEGTGLSTSRRPVAIYLEVSDVNAYHQASSGHLPGGLRCECLSRPGKEARSENHRSANGSVVG